MSEPSIDVIMPVYNGAAFIGDAIMSIQAQTFKNVKIIIVDDGSEDDTANIVSEFAKADSRILSIQQQHLGIQFALNTAIAKATCDYVAFLDADDLWHPQKLEKQLKHINSGNFEICICMIQEFQDGDATGMETKHKARTEAMKGYNKTACMVRREVFSKYGLFDPSIAIGDFIEWFSRVIRDQKSVAMPEEVLAYRRIHNSNTTLDVNKSLYLRILKMHLDESRKANKA